MGRIVCQVGLRGRPAASRIGRHFVLCEGESRGHFRRRKEAPSTAGERQRQNPIPEGTQKWAAPTVGKFRFPDLVARGRRAGNHCRATWDPSHEGDAKGEQAGEKKVGGGERRVSREQGV